MKKTQKSVGLAVLILKPFHPKEDDKTTKTDEVTESKKKNNQKNKKKSVVKKGKQYAFKRQQVAIDVTFKYFKVIFDRKAERRKGSSREEPNEIEITVTSIYLNSKMLKHNLSIK